MEMLQLEKWRQMPLQVQFLSSPSLKHLANCPPRPLGLEPTVACLEVAVADVLVPGCVCSCLWHF